MQSAQHKKLYENALSSVQSTQSLEKALNAILRLAINDHSHFNFLLHNIDWFNEPYIHHFVVLEKALRIYRGRGKQFQKVVYNILADGMWSSTASLKACQCILKIIKTGFDQKLLKQSIIENYPHKAVQLTSQLNYLSSLLYLGKNYQPLRSDLLEIIILQLASFDTELCTGDFYNIQTFPPDQKIKRDRIKFITDAEHNKFDILITTLLEQLEKNNNNESIFKQLMVIFKNDLLLIKSTKYIQFILYYFAQRGKEEAKNFLTFLFSELYEKMQNKGNKRVITSLNNYLASYIVRSSNLSPSLVSKSVKNLIKLINLQLDKRKIANEKDLEPETKSQQPMNEVQVEKINLSKVFEVNFEILLLLQTVIRIWISRPECIQGNKIQFEKLCERCSKQTYFEYFINHQFLNQAKFIQINENIKVYEECLEIYHTFNPPLLKRLGIYVDGIILPYQKEQKTNVKIQDIKTQVKYEAIILGMPVKKVKSEKKTSQDTTFSINKK